VVSEVDEIPAPPPWESRRAPAAELSARRFRRDLDLSWQRTSFTRLTRGEPPGEGGPDDDGRDHDQGLEPAGASAAVPAKGVSSPGAVGSGVPAAAVGDEVPLACFPYGAEAGSVLHEVLEHLDLTRADDPEAVRAVLVPRLRSATFSGVDVDATVRGLQLTLTTPLGPVADGRALADLGCEDRLNELAFDLPVAGGYLADGQPLTLGRIAAVFEAHAADAGAPLAAAADRLRRREATPVRGFLTGSIDLVVRLRGPASARTSREPEGDDTPPRFVVVDHKSNRLASAGPDGRERSTVADHHPARMAEAMVAHDYLLQYHLYLVALHRYLAWRLDGYSYERNVAGVAYLFLRGMVGPDTPRAADGTPFGVYVDRPSEALIRDLDAVLRGRWP